MFQVAAESRYGRKVCQLFVVELLQEAHLQRANIRFDAKKTIRGKKEAGKRETIGKEIHGHSENGSKDNKKCLIGNERRRFSFFINFHTILYYFIFVVAVVE